MDGRLRVCWFVPTLKSTPESCAPVFRKFIEGAAQDHSVPSMAVALALKALRAERPDYEMAPLAL